MGMQIDVGQEILGRDGKHRVGVACLLGLPLKLGLIGVWIGFLLDENIRGVILTRRWHSLKWFGKSFT